MFGDTYPIKYMGKTTDAFRRLKFWLTVNLSFQVKTYAPDRASKIDLLMLVLEVMVTSSLRLKNTQWYFYGIHGMS